MRDYELTVLLKPDLAEKELDKDVRLLADLLEKNGAKIKSKKDPAKKALAYAISKWTEAYYVYLEITLESDKVNKLDEKLRLEEKIVRFLLVRKDK